MYFEYGHDQTTHRPDRFYYIYELHENGKSTRFLYGRFENTDHSAARMKSCYTSHDGQDVEYWYPTFSTDKLHKDFKDRQHCVVDPKYIEEEEKKQNDLVAMMAGTRLSGAASSSAGAKKKA